LTRMPCGPNSWPRLLLKVDECGLGGPVVERAGVRLKEGIDRRRHRSSGAGPLELVVARAKKPLEAKPDGTDVVHQHVDAAVLVHRAVDQPRRALRGGQVERQSGDTI
jgi:hypothetical protein